MHAIYRRTQLSKAQTISDNIDSKTGQPLMPIKIALRYWYIIIDHRFPSNQSTHFRYFHALILKTTFKIRNASIFGEPNLWPLIHFIHTFQRTIHHFCLVFFLLSRFVGILLMETIFIRFYTIEFLQVLFWKIEFQLKTKTHCSQNNIHNSADNTNYS